MALSIRVLCSSGVAFIAMMSVILSFAGCRSTIRAAGETPSMGTEASGRPSAVAFFRAPLLSHVTLSPDGRHIAAIFTKAGTETLMVRPSSGGEVRPLAKLVRSESSQSIRSSVSIRKVGWGSNERILVSVEMPLQNPYVTGIRARQSRLIVVELNGGSRTTWARTGPTRSIPRSKTASSAGSPKTPITSSSTGGDRIRTESAPAA